MTITASYKTLSLSFISHEKHICLHIKWNIPAFTLYEEHLPVCHLKNVYVYSIWKISVFSALWYLLITDISQRWRSILNRMVKQLFSLKEILKLNTYRFRYYSSQITKVLNIIVYCRLSSVVLLSSVICCRMGRGHRVRDRKVVWYTTTCAISAYHHYSCEF